MAALSPITTTPGGFAVSFRGSGSTLAAAKMLGRDYLGIELPARHHETAITRLQKTRATRAA